MVVDRLVPGMVAVTDDGGFTTVTDAINAVAVGSDAGQSGIAGYEYAVGTGAWPGSYDDVLTWTADADGVINHVFGSTVLSAGPDLLRDGASAKDNAANESQPLSTDGIVVDMSGPARRR